jgi:IclR family acetate operon transcriptional repressor
MGKAMMAWLPPSVVTRVMSGGCERYTERTITTMADMQRELKVIRSRGYAVNDEEWCRGLRAVAAPVWNRDGEATGSICVGGPTHLMTKPILLKYARIVCEGGMKISSQLGYQG